MAQIKKVAILGASGNFGKPITHALLDSNKFSLTIVSRLDSQTVHPEGVPVIHTSYELANLTQAYQGQDAVINVLGPGGVAVSNSIVDAALAASVKRFIINDFGWGPRMRGLKEFQPIQKQRREGWDYAQAVADAKPSFTWTGVTTGNPID